MDFKNHTAIMLKQNQYLLGTGMKIHSSLIQWTSTVQKYFVTTKIAINNIKIQNVEETDAERETAV